MMCDLSPLSVKKLKITHPLNSRLAKEQNTTKTKAVTKKKEKKTKSGSNDVVFRGYDMPHNTNEVINFTF